MTESTSTKIDVCPAAELPSGEMRLVEAADGLKIGVFNCDGEPVRDRGPLLARRRPARRGAVRPVEPVPWSAPATARCSTSPPAGRRRSPPISRCRTFPVTIEDDTVKLEVPERMATPETQVRELTEEERSLGGHQRRLQGEVRLPRLRGGLRLQGPQGPLPRGRRVDLRVQGRARVDARVPPEGLRPLRAAPHPHLGRQPRPDRLERHPLLRPRLREEQPRLVRGPRGHQEHLRPPRHPRGRAQVPLRRRRPVRVRGRLPPGEREARGAGRDLHRHGHRPSRARGPGPRVLGDDHPAQRQQAGGAQLGRLVGRLLRLRPRRRQGRDAAAGLLPDQHREHGPVRADADHRRGGLGRPLHRGLHRARSTRPTRCTRRWSRSSPRRAPGSATRPSRTGRRTSSTWSPSAPSPTRTRRWSGSTATSARS